MYETQKVKQTGKASKHCQAVEGIPIAKLYRYRPHKNACTLY